jgi:transcriptional regulator with XRE-family HTH domain
MVNLGEKIRTLRLERHLTQTELSKRIGVSKAMVSSYELEQRSPSYEVLIKIAAFFGVSSDYLLGLDKFRSFNVDGLSEKELDIIANMISALREK